MFTTRLFNLFVLATLLIVTACAPQIAITPNATAVPIATSTSVILPVPSQTWSTGLLPNGVWHVELTAEDVMKMGVTQSEVKDWAGNWTWTFQDGKAHILVEVGDTYDCKANYKVVDDVVRLTYYDGENCDKEIDDIQWRLDDTGLHLHLVAIQNAPLIGNRAIYEAKTWQKVK